MSGVIWSAVLLTLIYKSFIYSKLVYMPYFHFCVQVNVLLVTFTIVPLSHVTHVYLATSRETEDQGNVLRVLVECLPGLGEPPNVSVSVKIYRAYVYLLLPVCERLSACVCVCACVCACVRVWSGMEGVCVCVCMYVCMCGVCVYIDVCAYAHNCLRVHLDTCTLYSYYANIFAAHVKILF